MKNFKALSDVTQDYLPSFSWLVKLGTGTDVSVSLLSIVSKALFPCGIPIDCPGCKPGQQHRAAITMTDLYKDLQIVNLTVLRSIAVLRGVNLCRQE